MADLIATAALKDAEFRAGLSRMDRSGKQALGGIAREGGKAGRSMVSLGQATKFAKVGILAATASAGIFGGMTARYTRANEQAAASLRDVGAAADRLALSMGRELFIGTAGGAGFLAAAIDRVTNSYLRLTGVVNRLFGDGGLLEARRQAKISEGMDQDRRNAEMVSRLGGSQEERRARAGGRDMDALKIGQEMRRRALLKELEESKLPINERQRILDASDAADKAERGQLGAQIGEAMRNKRGTERLRKEGRSGERTLEGAARFLHNQVFGPGATSTDPKETERLQLEELRRVNRNLDRLGRGAIYS